MSNVQYVSNSIKVPSIKELDTVTSSSLGFQFMRIHTLIVKFWDPLYVKKRTTGIKNTIVAFLNLTRKMRALALLSVAIFSDGIFR